MKKRYIDVILIMVIFILFLFTSISPMISGMTNRYHDEEHPAFLDNLRFFAGYDNNNISTSLIIDKYINYMQYFDGFHNSKDELNLEETFSASSQIIIEKPSPQTSSFDPLDSPWPMYCHDKHHTGRSPYIPIDYPIEKWRYFTKFGGYGSPVVDNDGVLYFGGNDFHAVYPNGTEKWTISQIGEFRSNPVLDEYGIIYAGSSMVSPSYLYAFYPNGGVKWQKNYGEIYSSPVIDDDGIIYFGRTSGDEGAILAVYSNNGTIKWIFPTNHVVYSSPAIGNDGTIYCGCHNKNLYALYPNNGTEKWHYTTGDWIRTSPCIGDDGTIYVVSLDSYLHAVFPNNGTMKWKTNVGAGTSPTIGLDGTIYCGYTQLYAVNPNGSVKWTFNPGSDRKIRGATPCNDANGTIYFGVSISDLQGGEIIAVNSEGTERWRKEISNNHIESAPCIDGEGSIYIVSDNRYEGAACYLHCFGTVENNQPPEMIFLDGTINGVVSEIYEYEFYADDSNNNPVAYYVDWGDDTNSGWTIDYIHLQSVFLWHRWSEEGTYTIKVKAKDTVGAESDWMTLEITMPVNQQIHNSWLIQFLQNHPNLFPKMRFIYHF